jgi:hypothetical protein
LASLLVRFRVPAAAAALALASAALYAGSLREDFVDFDDRTVLLAQPDLYDEDSLRASLAQIFLHGFPREEPLLLRDLSWALDARLFGFRNPLGYHLGNVLLNALNVALLFWFLQRTTRRFTLSLAAAGAFAVLPVHVEAVSWVMGRKDVLSAALVLGALVAQSYELDADQASRRRDFWLLGLLLTCLALLAKIAAMSCVALLALHRVFHPYLTGRCAPGEPLDWPRIARDVVPRLLPHAIVTAGIVLWYQRAVAEAGVTGWRGPGPLSAEHLAHVASFAPLVIASYLRSLVLPTELSVFYRWPHVEIPLAPLEWAASVATALALAALVAWSCLRRRDLAFWVLAFGALLLPYAGVVYVDIWRADRYVYLASFAPVALAALGLAALAARGGRTPRIAVAAAAGCFVLISAAQTLRQQAVWADNESLWRHETSLASPSVLSFQALAAERLAQAERAQDPAARRALIEQARADVQRGIERERALGRRPAPYATSEQLQLGKLHSLLGRIAGLEGAPLEQQIAHYEAGHRIAPHKASAFVLAKLYLELAGRAQGPERERLVLASFERFLEYLALTAGNPALAERNEALLANVYEKRFPFLAGEVVSAREKYLR